jgi:hypothetical protein
VLTARLLLTARLHSLLRLWSEMVNNAEVTPRKVVRYSKGERPRDRGAD